MTVLLLLFHVLRFLAYRLAISCHSSHDLMLIKFGHSFFIRTVYCIVQMMREKKFSVSECHVHLDLSDLWSFVLGPGVSGVHHSFGSRDVHDEEVLELLGFGGSRRQFHGERLPDRDQSGWGIDPNDCLRST